MKIRFILCAVLLVFACVTNTFAENWPQWRGPRGDNTSKERNLPIVWSETRGLLWKCPLPEYGCSTPAIWGDAIFVTAHVGDKKLILQRIDKGNGEVVWTREVGEGSTPRDLPKRGGMKFHRLHNLATPSPVTNGDVVVVHFGNGDLAAYDLDGNKKWKRNLQDDYGAYSIWWGHGNSPVLFGNTVISVCMQDSMADLKEQPVESYIVAHDVEFGRTRWKTSRMTGADAEECDSYTTPLIFDAQGRTEMVIMGGNQLDSYDPASGKQLWYLPNLVGGRTVTGPTLGGDYIFCTHGMRGPLLAVRLGGHGKLDYKSVAWKVRGGTPDSVSPVYWREMLYIVSDDGIARCYKADSGNILWKARLPGNYKATPLVAEGRLFFLNTTGLCTIISATSRFDKLVENQLDDTTIASPIASDGRIFIRGHKTLYCIGKKPL